MKHLWIALAVTMLPGSALAAGELTFGSSVGDVLFDEQRFPVAAAGELTFGPSFELDAQDQRKVIFAMSDGTTAVYIEESKMLRPPTREE